MQKTSKYYNTPTEVYDAAPVLGCGDDKVVEIAQGMVEGWVAGGEVVSRISGGITNMLYKVTAKNGNAVLIRLYGENTDKLIDRNEENRILAELSKVGFAPGFFGKFKTGRVEEFLPMRNLKPEEMAMKEFIPAIARELNKLHSLTIPPVKPSSLIPTIERFLKIARGCEFEGVKKAQLDMLELERVESMLELLQDEINKMSNFMTKVVFAHKDLLSGNVLVPTTYESGEVEKVQIIDFEYSDWDYRGFDFGNHFAEHAGFDCDYDRSYPTDEVKRSIIQQYLIASPETPDVPIEDLVREADIFAVASHLYWGIWAVVQARYSPIDFDFMHFAFQRFCGYHYQKQFCYSEKPAEPKSLAEIARMLTPQ
eukprot:TRINITY_DN8210_c1_g1_i1.p1 TRINITY_DN8210_c1_g1~~TRINITY_DN8210_c1_g1_i1.p1  ORF type:complete len:368 (+),score=58.42 TRINITY_DN8210_c1_g1_i1:44-1147(+)